MRTSTGCTVWITIFVAVLLIERALLQRLDLPGGGTLVTALAVLLALGVTLTAGSLHGLLLALRQRRGSMARPGQWREGEAVRVGGVLEAVGEALQAPFSGRAAIFMTYGAHAPQRGLEGRVPQDPHFRGLQHVRCRLRVDDRHFELRGFPSPRAVAEQVFDGPEVERAAARHLMRTPWQPAPEIASLDLAGMDVPFVSTTPGTGPDAGTHLMNTLAREFLALPRADGSESALLARLRERRWHFKERVLAPGEAVTVVGTWHEQPPHIDIACGLASADHAVYPGTPERLAGREAGTALAFLLVVGTLTVAGHLLLWQRDRAWVRQAIDAMGIFR